MTNRLVPLLVIAALSCACDSDDPAADAGPAATTDAGGGVDSGPPIAGMAVLTGAVSRTAEPMADGVGGLYIAVFDRDPVSDPDNAMAVGMVVVEDVDMTDPSTTVDYTVMGIPPRTDPYFVTAFLDDNDNATMSADAGPDRGDLVAIEGVASSPRVTLDAADTFELDLVLNFNLPF